jgi:hypothetical protein
MGKGFIKVFGYGVLLMCLFLGCFCAQEEDPSAFNKSALQTNKDMRPGEETRRMDNFSQGYILYSPLLSTITYLIDSDKKVVHTWESEFPPGVSVYLLDNGNLLRTARSSDVPFFLAPGQGGRIQEYTWEGELVWDFALAKEDRILHHDIEPLPNGNVLAIAWERKTRRQAIRAGRRIEYLTENDVWPDCILEIQPKPPLGGRIVWEWHVWDHLIQDTNPSLDNFGHISDHPELVDINGDQKPLLFTDKNIERLRALGYLHEDMPEKSLSGDLLHSNSIAYNPKLDQILLSVLTFNEIWIIDHGTTTREAAGHTGGRAGKGGDLLYRWGNPQSYGRGTAEHQYLFGQHDARWIPEDYPGEGNILIFNNGDGRPKERYSSVIEIQPPLDENDNYKIKDGSSFGPDCPVWRYIAPNKRLFFADFISGAHRLPNGNTFICSGPQGRFFEVTPKGEIVWEFKNPFSGKAPNPAGDPPYSVFRATHISNIHPSLKGRKLKSFPR